MSLVDSIRDHVREHRSGMVSDLLFALVLRYYGLSSSMSVSFRGMVGHDASLIFPETDTGAVQIADRAGNVYLEMERSGAILDDPSITEAFIRRYAAFSGRNFPEFLEPLMRQQGVMFNPSRPMVLYDSMTFSLQAGPSPGLDMEISDASLDVAGRRADEWLHFRISDGDRPVGTGSKKVVISGLQPWDEARMQAFIHDYAARRDGQPA